MTQLSPKQPGGASVPGSVQRVAQHDLSLLRRFLARLGLDLHLADPGQAIPGSYWGAEEAGLVGRQLWLRLDTPLHSVLHEAAHYACMDEGRRRGLHTDAGGDYDEENAVCYLQILWADEIAGFGRRRMLADMDAWGYTFRLGSARAWFESDAEDARQILLGWGLVGPGGRPTYRLRGAR